jgi:DNA mismatch repair protein MutH
MPAKLSTADVQERLSTFDFATLAKPGRNKGERGQLLETALGVANSSDLKDLIDGEIKSFTQGQTISVTQLNHCLQEILEKGVTFTESKVFEKLNQTIYVGFTRSNDYLGFATINQESDPVHYQQLAEDYDFICDTIRTLFNAGKQLRTTTGPNKLLQIRTKASKTNGRYVPLTFAGCTLKDKGMAFYLCGKYGREVL